MKQYYNFVTILLTLLIITGCDNAVIYNGSEMLDNMPRFEVFIDNDENYYLLQDKATKSDVPVKIVYEGEQITGFIRSSGGGSRLHPRWGYRVKLNEGFEIENLSSFSLSSRTLDPTMIHTTIVSHIYRQRGFPVFRSKHVFLKINNQDKGLFMIMERIDENFLSKRNIPIFEMYKALFGGDLSFNPEQHPQFTYEKKLPEDDNYFYLFEFINALDTCQVSKIEQSLAKYVNIDNYLQYHAISSIINNNDAFQNNYYLYRQTAITPYNFIPWDFDRAFESHQQAGLAGKNTLFNKISKNQNIRDKYKAEINYLLDNSFREDVLFPIIDSTAAYIEKAYNLDPYLGAGGYNLNTQVNQLKESISNRISFYMENIDNF